MTHEYSLQLTSMETFGATHSLQSKQSPAKQDDGTNSAIRVRANATQSSYDVPVPHVRAPLGT